MVGPVQIFIGILLLVVGFLLYGIARWKVETSDTGWGEFIVLLVIAWAGVGILVVADRFLPKELTLTDLTRWIIGGICIVAGYAFYFWFRSRVDGLSDRSFFILYGIMIFLFSLGVRVIFELAP